MWQGRNHRQMPRIPYTQLSAAQRAAIVVAARRQERSLTPLGRWEDPASPGAMVTTTAMVAAAWRQERTLTHLGRWEDRASPGLMVTMTAMVVAAGRREDRARVCDLWEGP